MRAAVRVLFLGTLFLAAAGCGGRQVRVAMPMVPDASWMGDVIGRNAARIGCSGRPRRGRFQLVCPTLATPGHRVTINVYDGGALECVVHPDYQGECALVYNELVRQ